VNTVSKDGPVTLGTREWRLVVNGAQLPEALTGVQDLAAQLVFAREIRVRELVTHRFALERAPEALAFASRPAPGVLKVMVEMGGGH